MSAPDEALEKIRRFLTTDPEAESRPAQSPPPRRLGRYELLELLGEGGMGIVFRARDTELGREVALKMLKTAQSFSPTQIERFKREERNAARLKHPGIVSIYEIGREGDVLYYTMELVAARPFDPARGSLEDRVRILERVARAVHYAHEQGVIHRDLKPANILVDGEGAPRLLDFGLSREIGTEGGLSRTGTLLGTPYYMAPEQAEGRTRETDARADVYALGVLLYQILAGRVPFPGPEMTDILRGLLTEKPAAPPGPEGLAAVALKAMEKDPARRYPTAGAFAEELARHLEGKPVEALPRRSPWKRRGAAALAAAILIAATVALWKPDRPGPLEEVSRSQFDELFGKLRPPPDEPWRAIPWKLSIPEAQHEAARAKKPIFLWAMNGHPLGCAGASAVLDRAALFADPADVETLKRYFVLVALDERDGRHQKDAAGEFFRKVVLQTPMKDFTVCVEGKYVCTPDGTLLGYMNHYGPDRLRRLLREALDRYVPAEAAPIAAEPRDSYFDRKAPRQGLVLNVTGKVLGGYGPADDYWQKTLQSALARDRLWIWKDEADALARGELPAGVTSRILRFTLLDHTRGLSSAWEPADVKNGTLTLAGGRLTGSVHLESASNRRGYQASLLGFVESREGKVTRFDIVARGLYWTSSANAPPGRYPFAVVLTLAERDAWFDLPPMGSRDPGDYSR